MYNETLMAQIEPVERKSLAQVVHKIENLLTQYESETALIEKEFSILANQWYLETLYSSAYLDKVLHPAYQRIIGLGKRCYSVYFARIAGRTDRVVLGVAGINR